MEVLTQVSPYEGAGLYMAHVMYKTCGEPRIVAGGGVALEWLWFEGRSERLTGLLPDSLARVFVPRGLGAGHPDRPRCEWVLARPKMRDCLMHPKRRLP